MIGRRRQKERTQLFQITAYFSLSRAGRAEAGPLGRGSQLTWHCPHKPCWGSSRPVTTTPLTLPSLPTEERREAAFSLSLSFRREALGPVFQTGGIRCWKEPDPSGGRFLAATVLLGARAAGTALGSKPGRVVQEREGSDSRPRPARSRIPMQLL